MAELSVISTTTVIRGGVRGQGSLRVDGRVRGNVEVTGDVVIGPGAEIQGSVSGASLSVSGAVEGDLTGTEAVLLETTARVVGDLRAPRIGISEGAQVRGSVQTEGAPAAAPAPRLAATRPVAKMAPPVKAPVRQAAVVVPAPQPAATKSKASKKKTQKKAPPPVVHAPKRGSKGRKKRAKR